MAKRNKVVETGAIIGCHESWGGRMVSVAVTLAEQDWDELTRAYAELWRDAEDDLEVRELTLDERIALFVSAQADGWRERQRRDVFGDDSEGDVPF